MRNPDHSQGQPTQCSTSFPFLTNHLHPPLPDPDTTINGLFRGPFTSPPSTTAQAFIKSVFLIPLGPHAMRIPVLSSRSLCSQARGRRSCSPRSQAHPSPSPRRSYFAHSSAIRSPSLSPRCGLYTNHSSFTLESLDSMCFRVLILTLPSLQR